MVSLATKRLYPSAILRRQSKTRTHPNLTALELNPNTNLDALNGTTGVASLNVGSACCLCRKRLQNPIVKMATAWQGVSPDKRHFAIHELTTTIYGRQALVWQFGRNRLSTWLTTRAANRSRPNQQNRRSWGEIKNQKREEYHCNLALQRIVNS